MKIYNPHLYFTKQEMFSNCREELHYFPIKHKNKQNFRQKIKTLQLSRIYLVGDDELVQVDHHEVLDAAHVPVQTVIESCEQPLCPNLLLADHVQPPGEQGQQAGPDVVIQQAGDLGAHCVIVHREPCKRDFSAWGLKCANLAPIPDPWLMMRWKLDHAILLAAQSGETLNWLSGSVCSVVAAEKF